MIEPALASRGAHAVSGPAPKQNPRRSACPMPLVLSTLRLMPVPAPRLRLFWRGRDARRPRPPVSATNVRPPHLDGLTGADERSVGGPRLRAHGAPPRSLAPAAARV